MFAIYPGSEVTVSKPGFLKTRKFIVVGLTYKGGEFEYKLKAKGNQYIYPVEAEFVHMTLKSAVVNAMLRVVNFGKQ